MAFDPMDLSGLSDPKLGTLLELFRTLAMEQKNRVAMDLFAIVEREMLARHQSTPISEYPDNDLVEAVQELTSLVDHCRSRNISDNYPTMQFLLLNLTVLIAEAERRGLVKDLQ